LASLSFLYRWTIPNCVLPASVGGDEHFASELRRLRRLRTEVAAFELVRPLYDHGGRPQPSRGRILPDPAIRAAAIKNARLHGSGTQRAATQLFDDARGFVARFAGLLEAYWQEAFEEEWHRIEPMLADEVVDAGRRIAGGGVYPFLLGLAPQLRVEPQAEQFGLDLPHDHEIELGPRNPLVLVPSIYVWPHVRVNCDRPWPLTLVYRAPHLVKSLHRRAIPSSRARSTHLPAPYGYASSSSLPLSLEARRSSPR
jgi:Family of unknown function (DUF5937)